MRSHTIFLVLAPLAAPVASATAVDNPLEEVVVTASRSQQAVADVPSNISLVTRDTLEQIGHTHINEAMQRIAGAWISRGNGQEHLTALRSPVLTGAGSCGAFLMAQDGIPLRASGFCNVNELFDANTEQAGRIEVIKGPASVMYGSNAMHGMINVVTAPVAAAGALSLEGGPHDYVRGKVSMNRGQWRLDFNGTSDGGWKEESGFDQQKLTIKHEGRLGAWRTSTVLSGANLNQETAGFVQGTDAYRDDALRQSNPNPEAYRDVWSARLYSTLAYNADNGNAYRITPYFRSTRMNFLQHFLPGQPLEQNEHHSVGVQTAAYLGLWTVGFDAESTRGELIETQDTPISGSAFLMETIPVGKHYDYEVDATTIAAFARYEAALTGKLSLTAGLRAEQVEYDYDNRMIDGRLKADGTPCAFGGCRFSRPSDRTDSFFNLSPRLGLRFAVTDSAQLYGWLSRGFRAPQATELYRLQNTQTVSNIDSEELDSLEVGLRGSTTSFSYEVSAYTMRKENFIFRDSTRTNVDNGETSHQGLEITLAAPLARRIRGEVNWSFARHRYENNPALASRPIEGNDIDTAPRSFGSANLSWQHGNRLNAELEWVHLGRYYQDPENEQSYPGHDLINLRLRFRATESITAFARIMNLTDEDYAERADFAFGNDRYFVGEPRSVYVGIQTRL